MSDRQQICIKTLEHCWSVHTWLTLRVHVLKNWVLMVLVVMRIIVVQILGKYMFIRYLDP